MVDSNPIPESETSNSNPLRDLARLISLEPERFNSATGDEEIQNLSKLAMVHSFHQSVSSESLALPSITNLLHSYLPSSKSSNARSTRASKRKRDDAPSSSSSIDPTNLPPHDLFKKTPLDNLIVQGMKESQIWNQLELKGSKIAKLVDSVVINEIGLQEPEAGDEEEEDDEDLGSKKKNSKSGGGKKRSVYDEEMDSDDPEEDEEDEEEMQLSSLSDSDLKALGLSQQQIESFRSKSLQDSMEESDEESAGGDGYPGASDLSDEDEAEISFEPLRSEEEQRRRKHEKEMEEMKRLRGLGRARNRLSNGGGDDDEEDESTDEDDEEEEEEVEMEMDEEDAELLRMVQEEEAEEEKRKSSKKKGKGKDKDVMASGFFGEMDQEVDGSKKSLLDRLDEDEDAGNSRGKTSGSRHPTLDDDFFSIDAFNRLTENSERNNGSLGSLSDGGNESLEDDLDLFQNFDTNEGDDDDEEEQGTARPPSKKRSRIDAVLKPASEISYSDFFDPPPRTPSRSRGSKGSQQSPKSKGSPSKMTESPASTSTSGLEEDQDDEMDVDAEAIKDANVKELKAKKDLANKKKIQPDSEEGKKGTKVRFVEQVKIKPIKARKSTDQEILQELLNGDRDEGHDEEDEGQDEEDEDEEDEEVEELLDEDEQDEDESMNDDFADFGEEEPRDRESDDEEEEDDDEDEDGNSDLAHRVAGDLFDDDDDEQLTESSAKSQSAHEKRLAALKSEIAQLESENVAPRDWTLSGEASSRARPSNSLLERDLDFEHINKSVPQATDVQTNSIEELIKARILSHEFDDVIRRRNLDGERDAFLPSKIFDLDDTKGKSLNQVYEDEFNQKESEARGFEIEHEKDEGLRKEHEEIEGIFNETCAMLDALCNAHYTPKAPKAVIQTITDAPRISMESSLPSSTSTSSMLAPEEIYSLPKHSVSVQGSSSEREIGESIKIHDKIRNEKKKKNQLLEKVRKNRELNKAESNGGGNGKGGDGLGIKNRMRLGDEKKEKEKALNKLIGNKGVSVIGKGEGKKGKGGNGQGSNGKAEKGQRGEVDNSNKNWKL